ncbi:peptidyl-prolyl cis-trans isomerase, partial [candidate division NPL-UPA2 bacterium]|nr:peptidyl-prolyl cis-trans isomerase [candidate division NPL-UPA2 bacterium]
FQANREEFRIPDRVNAEYIIISFRPEEMKVEEEEIVDYYQEHLERFKKEGVKIPLEEVRMEIRDTLANQKAERKAREEAKNLAYDLFDRAAWETMVKERRLKVKETGFFARGEVIKDLGWAPNFVEEAFALEEDEVSGAIRTPQGYAILIVKERSEAHLPQLEEVRDKVEERVRGEKARALARAKAEECLKRLKEGIDFEEAAQEFSREVKDSKLFSRGEYIEGIGFSFPFAETAFSLQEGGISPVVEVGLGFAILKGKERKGIDEEKFALEAEEFRKALLPWKQMEVYNQWYRTLRKESSIWIDPDFWE